MDFADVVATRQMTRDFAERAVQAELLERVLAAGLRVPSAGNAQGVDLLVLTSAAARERFWAAVGDSDWRSSPSSVALRRAPAIILPVADPATYVQRYGRPDKAGSSLGGVPAEDWPVPYWLVDASFAAMAVLYGAADAALGALFFQLQGSDDAVRAALSIPAQCRLIGAIALGHRADDRSEKIATARRANAVHLDRW